MGRHITYRELSQEAESWGVNAFDSAEKAVESLVGKPERGLIDRGSLLRIAAAVEKQAKEIAALRREMKEMMAFWKELRADYRKQKGIDDGDKS
jgi:hypothetical protein